MLRPESDRFWIDTPPKNEPASDIPLSITEEEEREIAAFKARLKGIGVIVEQDPLD